MTAALYVRCRECCELIHAVKVGPQMVQLKVHQEPDTEARCVGSLSIVPMPAKQGAA